LADRNSLALFYANGAQGGALNCFIASEID
jgi:hypothetical protein